MNKLLKDAIADAKAVRETALANAKATLEEAFAPKLQSMLSHKIKEELDEMPPAEDELEVDPSMEGDMEEAARMRSLAGIVGEGDDSDEDDMGAADEVPPAPAPEAPPADAPPAEGEEMPPPPPPAEGEEDMGGEDEFAGEEGEEVSDEELAELLRELEGEDEEMMDEPGLEDPTAELAESADEDADDAPGAEEEEEVSLDEIISALKEEDDADADDKEDKMEEAKVAKAELQEAYGVIKFLRSKLNEVNLLNAKLLFVSKLFKKGELNEAQKVRIIETFDRAKTVREAKLIYTTLVESVRTKKTVVKPVIKKKMNEGLASAPQKKTVIIAESNTQFNRFKELMNFNKH